MALASAAVHRFPVICTLVICTLHRKMRSHAVRVTNLRGAKLTVTSCTLNLPLCIVAMTRATNRGLAQTTALLLLQISLLVPLPHRQLSLPLVRLKHIGCLPRRSTARMARRQALFHPVLPAARLQTPPPSVSRGAGHSRIATPQTPTRLLMLNRHTAPAIAAIPIQMGLAISALNWGLPCE
jgi:hypothetical protein